VDNAYVYGFGNVNEITQWGVMQYNTSAAAIYHDGTGTDGPEEYFENASLDGYVYIVAWSDKQTYQAAIAVLIKNGVTVKTIPTSKWEVYATGINKNPGDQWPVNQTDYDDINDRIQDANDKLGGPLTSKGWVKGTMNECSDGTTGCRGTLIYCPGFTSSRFLPLSVNHTRFDGAQFMWYQPENTGINCETSAGSNYSGEYLIFRIGPLSELFTSECPCPEGFTKVASKNSDVIDDNGSSVSVDENNNTGRYRIKAIIRAGSVPIKKVTASLAYYSRSSSRPECSRCVDKVVNYGSFINSNSYPNTIPTNIPLVPHITDINNLGESDESSREVIWTNPNGFCADLQTQREIEIPIQLPPPLHLPEDCCADTMDLCVRYTFTDSLCLACDTVICYRIIQTYDSNTPNESYIFPTQESGKWQQLHEMERSPGKCISRIRSSQLSRTQFSIPRALVEKQGNYIIDCLSNSIPHALQF
jgi:hypothetical protein